MTANYANVLPLRGMVVETVETALEEMKLSGDTPVDLPDVFIVEFPITTNPSRSVYRYMENVKTIRQLLSNIIEFYNRPPRPEEIAIYQEVADQLYEADEMVNHPDTPRYISLVNDIGMKELRFEKLSPSDHRQYVLILG